MEAQKGKRRCSSRRSWGRILPSTNRRVEREERPFPLLVETTDAEAEGALRTFNPVEAVVTVAAEAAWTEVPPKARRRAADRVNANFFINHLKRTEMRRVSDFCWDAAYGKQGGCIKHLIERRQRNAGVQPGETGAVGELCRADGVKRR